MKLIPLLFLLAISCSVWAADDAAEAKAMIGALKKYREALVAGQTDAAVALTASFAGLPAEAVKKKTQDYVDATRSGRLRLWIFPTSAKVIDGCGSLIFGDDDEPYADDPAYMIKQGGEWKVVYKLTNWSYPYFQLSEKQKKAFEQLEIHTEAQMKELRAVRNPTVE